MTPATRLVWIETPANPLWTVTDIAATAQIAHAAGALLAVDVPEPADAFLLRDGAAAFAVCTCTAWVTLETLWWPLPPAIWSSCSSLSSEEAWLRM